MNRIIIALIPIILLLVIFTIIQFSGADSTVPPAKSNFDTSFTASTFVDKYKDVKFTGKRVAVIIKVEGKSDSNDPAKRAKEMRYFQTYVLKFLSFANAVNVISNHQKNEIIAQIDSAWIPILEQRRDVISVTVLDFQKNNEDFDKLPPKKQLSYGRSINEIHCVRDFILILKYDNSPVCVKPLTSEKLIQRGWIVGLKK